LPEKREEGLPSISPARLRPDAIGADQHIGLADYAGQFAVFDAVPRCSVQSGFC
jgi:hypothetical protein